MKKYSAEFEKFWKEHKAYEKEEQKRRQERVQREIVTARELEEIYNEIHNK